MTKYIKLKEEIKHILLSLPEDLEDDEEIYVSDNWELQIPRSDESRRVGTRNSLEAIYLIYDTIEPWLLKYPKALTDVEIDESVNNIYQQILEELVKDKILRKSAKINRAQIKKVIDNGTKET